VPAALVANGILQKNPRVGEVMSTSMVTASPSDTIADVVKRMMETGVRHIPVVDREVVVGLVSLTDIARRVTGHLISHCKGWGNL